MSMPFALSGIVMNEMLECLKQVTQLIPAAPRRRVHEFADMLWKAAAREINPTPLGLRVEINPALKTHYSARNRTFVITLSLQQTASDFMPQFVYGGGAAGVGPVGQYQTVQPSAQTQQIEQTRAIKAELEAEKQMAVDSLQQTDMLVSTETTELNPDGLQRKDRVVARAENAEEAEAERVVQLEERVQQLDEVREIIASDQPLAQERELRDAQVTADLTTTEENIQEVTRSGDEHKEETVEVGDEARAGGPMDQLSSAPTVESQMGMVLEEEEKESDVAELRLFRRILKEQVLPNIDLQIVRDPMILSAAEGDSIVMEVSTNSFRDTRRVNVNMLPVIRP